MDKAKHIILLGLRRSGTTITFKTFAQDERLICFDEPFFFHSNEKFKKRMQGFEAFHENKFRLQRKF